MKRGWWILKFAALIVLGVIALIVFGLIVQYLWNWLVPTLFAGPVISFWQGLGLLVLSKILFSGFGKGGGHWRNRGGHWGGYYWRRKWDRMSPEERERFKQKMWNKWCPEEKPAPPAESGVSNG